MWDQIQIWVVSVCGEESVCVCVCRKGGHSFIQNIFAFGQWKVSTTKSDFDLNSKRATGAHHSVTKRAIRSYLTSFSHTEILLDTASWGQSVQERSENGEIKVPQRQTEVEKRKIPREGLELWTVINKRKTGGEEERKDEKEQKRWLRMMWEAGCQFVESNFLFCKYRYGHYHLIMTKNILVNIIVKTL